MSRHEDDGTSYLEETEREITVFLTGVHSKTVPLNVNLNCTVEKIKYEISKRFLVPVQQQSLWKEGTELTEGSLWFYGITNFAHIELLVKVKGGAPMLCFSDLREEARWEYFESTERRLNQIRSLMHIPTSFTSRRSFEELTLERQADGMISAQRNVLDLLEVFEEKRRVAEEEDNVWFRWPKIKFQDVAMGMIGFSYILCFVLTNWMTTPENLDPRFL